MRQIFIRYPNKTRRLLEILVPGMSWVLITMPFWLSFWHPALVAYLIITFDIYWFYKSFRLAIYAIRSFLTITAHTKVDWLTQASSIPECANLYHVVIIPEYQEPVHILERTLDNLTKQDYPKKRLFIVLATEAKDPTAHSTAKMLAQKYQHTFGRFLVTRHILHNGEVAGKSSNMAWAAKQVVRAMKTWGVEPDHATVT